MQAAMKKIRRQKFLLLLLVPGFITAILFSYGPMFGYYMAFIDYKPTMGNFWESFFGSPFVGRQRGGYYPDLF